MNDRETFSTRSQSPNPKRIGTVSGHVDTFDGRRPGVEVVWDGHAPLKPGERAGAYAPQDLIPLRTGQSTEDNQSDATSFASQVVDHVSKLDAGDLIREALRAGEDHG